jgi:tRNA modification GTPase
MSEKDTAILLTPPGVAAISVIRLSGPATRGFLAQYFSKPTPANRCVHGTLRNERGVVLDDLVVVISAEGTVADLNIHGGTWVTRAVLNLAARVGFELRDSNANPTLAFDAENEIEQEVLQYLPSARTEFALRTLLAQPVAWAELMQIRSRKDLEAILADRALEHLLNPPVVAIVGAPNVGKSTLANQLFSQERSITADMPGTTRDWVGEIANIDGLAVMLVDTPGVRETSDAIERTAIERSGIQVRQADLVLLVLDASMPLNPDQEPLILAHPEAFKILNKIDRPTVWDSSAMAGLPIAAATGQGVDQLRHAIKTHFGCLHLSLQQPRIWTERQRSLVIQMLNTY